MPKKATAPRALKVAEEPTPAEQAAAEADPNPRQTSLLEDDDLGFVTIDDIPEHVNACFYGQEGSGKTTAAARMANLPGATKVLVINAEGGLKRQPLVKRGIDTSKIVVWPDPKKGEVLTIQRLQAVYRKIKSDLMNDPNSWTGVIFDSGTEITDALLNQVQGKRVTTLKNKGADVDEYFVDISDYGTMAKMFRDLLSKFRDLPCHFVVTALERRDVDKDTGKPMYGPAVIASLQTSLLGHPDYVLKFKQADEDGPYRALTKQNGKYRAKDRFDLLPKVMVEPSFDRVFDYQMGRLTADEDPWQADLKPNIDANVKIATEGDDAGDESAAADA